MVMVGMMLWDSGHSGRVGEDDGRGDGDGVGDDGNGDGNGEAGASWCW